MRQTNAQPRKKLYKKGKRWLVMLMAGILLAGGPVSAISVMPAVPVLALTMHSGTDGDSRWELSDRGILTIGPGTLASRSSASASVSTSPWLQYKNQITTINITGKVTLNPISRALFAGLPNLTAINGLDNLDFTGVTDASGLFYKDSSLENLKFSGKFTNATKLTNLFGNMTSLKTLDLTNMTTGTAPAANQLQDALAGDAALTDITFGGQVYTNPTSPLALPTGSGTWFDSAETPAQATTYQHTQAQGSATQQFIRSMLNATYVDENNHPLFTDGIYPGSTTYTERNPWQTPALANHIFTIQNSDPMTAFTPATVPVTNQQNIVVKMTSVAKTGIMGTVPWYLTDDQTIHLGSGTLPEMQTGTPSPFADISGATQSIVLDGKVKAPVNASGLFSGMVELQSIQGLDRLDTSATTNMSAMFSMLMKLSSGLEGITRWDTSKVTDMSQMFYGLNFTNSSNLIANLDLSGWDTQKVKSFAHMFEANQLTSITFGPNFKTTSQTDPIKGVQLFYPNPDKTKPAPPKWYRLPFKGADDPLFTTFNGDGPATYVKGTPASADMSYLLPDDTPAMIWKIWGAAGSPQSYTPLDPWSIDYITRFPYIYVDGSGQYQAKNPDPVSFTLASDKSDDRTFHVMKVQAKGIIGTGVSAVRWYLDMKNVLHILGGTLANADGATANPWTTAKTDQNQKVGDVATSIVVDAPTALGSNAAYLFADLPNVKTITGLDKVETAAATDMTGMFKKDPVLTGVNMGTWDTGKLTDPNSLKTMFDGDGALSSVTFSKTFAKTPVALPAKTENIWLRRSDGLALTNNQFTGPEASAGTYEPTPATYSVALTDVDTGETVKTIPGKPISGTDIGTPIDLEQLLTDTPDYTPADNTGPAVIGNQFTVKDGVATQTIPVKVQQVAQVGGPDQFPNAGRDSRLLLLAAGTTIALAGLVGMIIITSKTKKRS